MLKLSKMKKRFKNSIRYVLKIVVSGLIAFIVLTFFCFFYYNLPIKQNNETGSTDFTWKSNYFVSRFTEGITFNKTNNEGFTNAFDYNDNLNIYCLVMGSSHMGSLNVNYDEYTSYLLNEKDNNIYYNIGISSHDLLVCVDNLESAIKTYKPKVVVIETMSLVFDEASVDEAINHNRERIKSDYNKIVEFLESNQLIRILYYQFNNYKTNILNKKTVSNEKLVYEKINESSINKMLSYISEIANKYNTGIVIVYHPTTSLNEDGTLIIENEDTNNIFNNLCESYGISYINMKDRFIKEYKDNHILPYGFINTKVGIGHLNKYGHKMMADEIYKVIAEID